MRKPLNDWRYLSDSKTQIAHLFERKGKLYRSRCGRLTLDSLIDTLPIRFNRKCLWCISHEQRLRPLDHSLSSV